MNIFGRCCVGHRQSTRHSRHQRSSVESSVADFINIFRNRTLVMAVTKQDASLFYSKTFKVQVLLVFWQKYNQQNGVSNKSFILKCPML
jgi:hypothetical protein